MLNWKVAMTMFFRQAVSATKPTPCGTGAKMLARSEARIRTPDKRESARRLI